MGSKTVLVGISGGINSLVACYLLKRQGCKVIGLSILFSEAQDHHLVRDKEKLQSLFQCLDIPYHQIQEEEGYQTQVVDFLVASRISGHVFRPQIACNNLLMQTLSARMPQYQADTIATGHRGRVVFNHQTQSHEIYRSKDISSDQSHLLAFLPPEILTRMELPLMGIRQEDIAKIAETLDIDPAPQQSCLSHALNNLSPLLEQKIPKSFRQEGEVIHHFNQCVVGAHQGLHHFTPGIPLSPKEFFLRDDSLKNKCLIPVKIIRQRNQLVVMDKTKWIPSTHIILSHCRYSSRSNPHLLFFEGNLRIGMEDVPLMPAHIRHLNNRNILCELKKPWIHPLFPGEPVIVYGSNDGEKVVLGGKVFQAGHLNSQSQIQSLPLTWEQESHTTDEKPSPPKEISSFQF